MSPIEWFSLISPVVLLLTSLNGLALIPMPFEARLTAYFKWTILLGITVFIGWCMALVAVHVKSSALAINILQASQVLLTSTLLALSVTLVLHLINGKNLLAFLLKYLIKTLRNIVSVAGVVALPVWHIFAAAYSKYANDQYEDNRKKKSRQEFDAPHNNWRGDYSGQDNRHKY